MIACSVLLSFVLRNLEKVESTAASGRMIVNACLAPQSAEIPEPEHVVLSCLPSYPKYPLQISEEAFFVSLNQSRQILY